MAKTKISWTDFTFNPWVGCTRVSEGCRHCYAEQFLVGRLRQTHLWGGGSQRRATKDGNWTKPLHWNRQAWRDGRRIRVFCASLADVFEAHPDLAEPRRRLWDLIRSTPNLDWQILTKRPQHIDGMLPSDWGADGWNHVWLGTSIEDMRVADRAACLAGVPARVRFISYEPALGPLDDLGLDGIHWVIYGGESGPHFRPDNPDWARSMRDRCKDLDIDFWYKQSAARRSEQGRTLDGVKPRKFPNAALADDAVGL